MSQNQQQERHLVLNGPGKYDDACTAAREITGGNVILIVSGGKLGHGFSVQADIETLAILPKILRGTADGIERELEQSLPQS